MTLQTANLETTVVELPLAKLKPSAKNARKTQHRPTDIETLAASIAAKGVLQPLVVEPEKDEEGQDTGSYLVTIGEGRRQALLLLVQRKHLRRNPLIRCILDVCHDPFEISLDENITRFAMHPADQFEAFQKLAEEHRLGEEEIAARFGVTPTVVRQRLRLAAVSERLIGLYREEALTLDQLMAFAATKDQQRQEEVWDALSWNRDPGLIRRMLTEGKVRATDRRARLIGQAAYEAAGGVIERDLFQDDQGGQFVDAALLDRLVMDRLSQAAQSLISAGWKWAEPGLDRPVNHGCRRIYPQLRELTEVDEALYAALSQEHQALVIAIDPDGEVDQATASRLADINAALTELDGRRRAFDPQDQGRAGAFVTLGYDGVLVIEAGFIRPQDEPAPERGEGDPELEDDSAVRSPSSGPGLSEKLVGNLTSHFTAALSDRLGQDPNLALSATVYALVLAAFPQLAGSACLRVSLHRPNLAAYGEGLNSSLAQRAVETRHAEWLAILGEGDLWSCILAMDQTRQLELLAHCASLSVDAVTTREDGAPDHAQHLARALGLDMADYWRPTCAVYLGRVTKPLILEAVTEAVSQEAAIRIKGLAKAAMAESAEALLADTRWLPKLLRCPQAEMTESLGLAAE